MAGPRRDLTDKQISLLREYAAEGVLKCHAAKRLGVTHGWLVKSAKRIGFIDELNELFPDTRNVSFELTEAGLSELRRLAEMGRPRSVACRALGVCDSTLTAAAKERGALDELRKLFPHGGRKEIFEIVEQYEGIKRVEEVDIEIPAGPAVYWLTQPWRTDHANF